MVYTSNLMVSSVEVALSDSIELFHPIPPSPALGPVAPIQKDTPHSDLPLAMRYS